MDYALDTQAARKADQLSGAITESGKYTGTLIRAESVKSQKGTVGIEFTFKSDDGQIADYLQLWTQNGDGEVLSGRNGIMALMTCLKIKSIKQVSITDDKWDDIAKIRVPQTVPGYQDLMNKPIGIVLQKELYTNSQGADKEKMSIINWFDTETERTAGEILDQVNTPAQLPKIIEWLMKKPFKDGRKKHVTPSAPTKQSGGYTPPPIDDLSDDIPF